MSGGASEPALLSLHGVRVLGAPSTAQVADRFGLRAAVVAEHLLDAQAYGWVRRHEFFGETWSMTERGRAENERQLAAELDAVGGRAAVAEAHRLFLSLNGPHGVACTNWQVRPTRWDRLAANDHTDADWDVAVLLELERLDNALQQVDALLSGALPRMKGYGRLHREALHRVASEARSVSSSARSKASSLKGTVTFAPLPPAAKKASSVGIKASTGASTRP